MTDDIYLTVGEVATHFRVSEATIRNLLTQDKLPGVKIGSQWRIPRSVLEVGLEPPGEKDAKPEG